MHAAELNLFVALTGALALVGIIGGLVHAWRGRLLTHQERMKALELGREIPDDTIVARIKAVSGKCFSTAVYIGAVGFLAAIIGESNTAVAVAVAAATGAIGVTAVICGTILALRTPTGSKDETSAKTVVVDEDLDLIASHVAR